MSGLQFEKGKQVIVGVGSALVDMLAREEDAFLEKLGVEKGGMNLVESDYIEQLVARIADPPSIVPGGSACNTALGVGMLGGHSRFVGKLGQDSLGDMFREDLKKNHVEPVLFPSDLPTGRVLSVITPDAQRSMFTYLGAAAELKPEEITPDCFAHAAVVHVEGYLLFNRELMLATIKAAKSAGARVSLDLASFNVVEESKDLLEQIVADYIDILIANEDEAGAFTGETDEGKALTALSKNVEMAVLKVGHRGSVVNYQGEDVKIEPLVCPNAVDSTGAGDLWAAGFLFGLVSGYSIEKSGELASACGSEVCQVVGANIPADGWGRIRKLL
ncbi:MAG: adenosine kinase [Desulfobacterales bacterium]|nr:adenosine kinase [Desulfobacterales bacterium]